VHGMGTPAGGCSVQDNPEWVPQTTAYCARFKALEDVAEAAKRVDKLCGWPNGDPDLMQASALANYARPWPH